MNPEPVEEWTGIPLIEVFNIIYLGHDEVPPEKQLGTISICRSQHDMSYLYKVDEVDMKMPSIKFGDPVMVSTGGPITGILDFNFVFNLFCGAYTGFIEVEWEEELQQDIYEVSLYEEKINSDDGTSQIRIQFGMFANATVANVAVTLLGKSGHTNVHGFVVARNSRLDFPTRASILFWIKSDNEIQVSDEKIPLSKSCVGVPLGSEFYLAISLVSDNQELNNPY